MREFAYQLATDLDGAVAAVAADPDAAYLAGGTTQLDLIKDGVWTPRLLVDISRLPMRGITVTGGDADPESNGDADAAVLRVGSLTTMEELARHPVVVDRAPLVGQALLASASTQLRNTATIGGNLLQRTRCRYYRDPDVAACNRRAPGSGCAAVAETARMHAVLGAGPSCIAAHASDLAVALVALDAVVEVAGPAGTRRVPLRALHVPAAVDPAREHVLAHGELITAVEVPLPRIARCSAYLKVRDRASYEFAAVSVAAALDVTDGVVRDARIAFGGIGTVPWRAEPAEAELRGAPATDAVFRAAGEAALAGAFTVPGTEFKPDLAVRTLVRLLGALTGVRRAVMA